MCITPCQPQRKSNRKVEIRETANPKEKHADQLPSTTFSLSATKHDRYLRTTTLHRTLPGAIFRIPQLSLCKSHYFTGGEGSSGTCTLHALLYYQRRSPQSTTHLRGAHDLSEKRKNFRGMIRNESNDLQSALSG